MRFEALEQLLQQYDYADLTESEQEQLRTLGIDEEGYEQRRHLLLRMEAARGLTPAVSPALEARLLDRMETSPLAANYWRWGSAIIGVLLCSSVAYWLGRQHSPRVEPVTLVQTETIVDTVYIEKIIPTTRYLERVVNDTIYLTQTDTVLLAPPFATPAKPSKPDSPGLVRSRNARETAALLDLVKPVVY